MFRLARSLQLPQCIQTTTTFRRLLSYDAVQSSLEAPKAKGRRPRSVRETPPDPFVEEKKLLSNQLAQMQQSISAKETAAAAEPELQKRNRPRNRINTAKLHLLSGHDKIELFQQLLNGGPNHLNDAAVLYSLICKNGISNRLKYQDFHNLFRLLCSQKEANRYPLLVQRVWRDWGRKSPEVGIYSVASYAAYTKIIVNWGDRRLARKIFADMKRDGIVGPDAITEANGGLKIDTYNQLLQLFTTPVRQLDTSKLVEAAQEVERNPNSTSDEIILQPPYIETNVQTTWTDPIKPSQQDLLFAQQELLPCVNTLNTATTTTHVHILTLFAGLQDLKGLISAHEAAFDQIQETISQSEEPIEFCHALLKINAHSIDCFLDAGFAPHAVAVVRSLPNGVIKSTERLFLVEDSPLVGPDGSDGTSSARLGSRGVDMIRKDAKKLLGVCLKALTWAGPSPVKKGEIEEKISLAESLVSSLNGVIGCQWDEFSVSCLVKLYGCVDLSKSEEWAIRGILWFGDDLSSGKGGVRVRTALAQVYAHRSTLVQLKHEWEELREKSLRIVEEREDKVVFGKGMCMALLDALDTLEIVAAEKGFEGTKETDERERAVRRRLG